VQLDNILENSSKNENLKKTWLLYFKKINKQEWACDERKNGIAHEFQMDKKCVNPNGGNVVERNNSNSMQFFFLEYC
jgi:hypothetical protein